MLLNDLKKSRWLAKKAKTVGRWNGSGKWNYSGRGIKGQGARNSGWVPNRFEWGQTPLGQRLPKLKWFKKPIKLQKHIAVIRLDRLEADSRIESGTQITKDLLVQLGYLKRVGQVKILGNGDVFEKKLEFVGMDYYSTTAKQKIEKAGSTIVA
jgi:large subunit ribosomal protein L15